MNIKHPIYLLENDTDNVSACVFILIALVTNLMQLVMPNASKDTVCLLNPSRDRLTVHRSELNNAKHYHEKSEKYIIEGATEMTMGSTHHN